MLYKFPFNDIHYSLHVVCQLVNFKNKFHKLGSIINHLLDIGRITHMHINTPNRQHRLQAENKMTTCLPMCF